LLADTSGLHDFRQTQIRQRLLWRSGVQLRVHCVSSTLHASTWNTPRAPRYPRTRFPCVESGSCLTLWLVFSYLKTTRRSWLPDPFSTMPSFFGTIGLHGTTTTHGRCSQTGRPPFGKHAYRWPCPIIAHRCRTTFVCSYLCC